MLKSEKNRYIQALEENMAAKFSFLPNLSPAMNVSTASGMLVVNSHAYYYATRSPIIITLDH